MIRALIFDCFGVLTTEGWISYRDSVFMTGSEDHEQARYLNSQVDRGLITYDDFLMGVAELAHTTKDQVKTAIEDNTANMQLFEYIRDVLKPHYKIGLLSNAGDNWLNDLFEPWQTELFDAVSLSYQSGMSKPDPRAYVDIAIKLNLDVGECVFIDDQPRFVLAAEDASMRGIVFENTASCISELKSLLTQ